MSCIQFGFTVKGDVDNRLAKSVEAVAGADYTKAQILAGYFSTDDFINHLREKTGVENPLNVNANTLRSILNSYFIARHKDVTETTNRKNADALNGFSSAKAKTIAKDHTANIITDIYYNEVTKPKAERLKNDEILVEVIKTINKNFNTKIAVPLISRLKAENNNKRALEMIDRASVINREIKQANSKRANLVKLFNNSKDGDRKAAINEQIRELDVELEMMNARRYSIFSNIVDEFGNVREQNYANLTSQVRGNPNEWFKSVFTVSKLINLVNDFEIVSESDKLFEHNYADENDIINTNTDSVDEMSKSWEDSLYKSYDRHVNANLKFYFNRLYRLSSPATIGSTEYNYDTNNELGVPMTMGANFVITQISNYASFYSVDDFINSISKTANNIPSLYGLTKLVNDMIADREFANYVFTQLANPKIQKTIVTITDSGINFDQSNKAVEPLTYMVYNLINSAKSTYKDVFDVNDKEDIKRKILSLNKARDNKIFYNGETIKELDRFIDDILIKYFPKLDKNSIRNYLHSNPDDSIRIYKEFLQDISNLLNSVESIIEDYNSEWSKFVDGYTDESGKKVEGYSKWAKKRNISNANGIPFNEAMPVFDYSSINYDALYPTIINLSKKLVNYTSVKNELNSINAEDNLASDLIGNNYITNFIKQIQYGTPEDANIGLERLKEFVTKSPQYAYSPFFFGVKDSTGKVILEGLFNRDNYGKVTINKNAKNLINVSLFDGAKDRVNSKSAMYSNMSKGDYFITQLVAFNQPINYISQYDSKVKTAGFFMRTPSDAPKNFIIQAPKYTTDNLWSPVQSSINAYMNKVQSDFANTYNFTTTGEFADASEDIILGDIKGDLTKNTMTANEIYDMLKNPINNKAYNRMYVIEDNTNNTVKIPILYKKGETTMIVWLQGDKSLTTMNKVAENLEIKEIYNPGIGVNGTVLPYDFLIDIRDTIIEDGVISGEIVRDVNHNNVAFRGFYNHLLGELNNYVNNLNNVFQKNKTQWVTKDNVDNLIDRVHYNGDSVVSNGKLSGNFFKFLRLFKTNNYDVETAMDRMLFLYGGGTTAGTEALFKTNRSGKLVLNTKRNDIIRINDGRIELNLSNENALQLEAIVENWLNSFYGEIISRTRQYDSIVDEKFTNNDVVDCMLNNAIMEMNFDDMFEGDVKFYKNAQDFLKRAKEVQAAGKAYAGFDINDSIGGSIYNITDNTGAEVPILIGDKQLELPRRGTNGIEIKPMYARNGFRAVTIENTIRPSRQAANIKKELISILTNQVGEVEANRIATEIAKGYFDNTKINDAQSYITLEEFIARKYADGTLHEYMDILVPLLDDKVDIKDIDLAKVNARIQVQKNFYFDKQFDAATGTYYPRQIKNAEFVLIPKLIKGTELEQLYNIMRRNDIGQVNTAETSKAAKKNVLTFWDNDTVAHPEEFEKAINGGVEGIYDDHVVENYYYRYLYKQQDVAEHMKDEHNKAGIQIMKKIIDNANESVQPHINTLFANYCANIREDFNTLLDRMGWKVNKKGNLVNSDSSKGDTLNFDEFYKKARIEAQRLGMDSNFIEYLTPDALGNPTMPNYMNNVSSKLESIAQSIFNSSITRQKLPGWHAAQVTGVGHGNNVLGTDGEMHELKYHPEVIDENGNVTQEAYAEVMLPRWSNLIPKDYDINKLAEEGLDIHIGYRIPTEGKQSVSILKVVGFLDDIYGSTIMLPDDWVTQTGADFDVDSVYGISYEMYKDREGTIKKITFDNDTSDEAVQRRYINYINRAIDEKVDKELISDEFIENKVNELRDELKDLNKRQSKSEQFNKFMEIESELFSKLPQNDIDDIKAINAKFGKKGDIVERYNFIANSFAEKANTVTDESLKEQYIEFADINKAIADVIALSRENKANNYAQFQSKISEELRVLFDKAKEDYFNKVEEVAKEANLPDFDTFSEWTIEEQNSRRARNNMILDSMVAIMNDVNSREENYSRSNFDDLVSAMKEMDELRGASSITRSAHNPLDQIDFMENAMSGTQLKAFSVTRDTFNSVNNYVKSKLGEGHEIVAEYDASEYDVINAISAYGLWTPKTTNNGVVALDSNNKAITDINKAKKNTVRFRIKHNQFAWSNNNRNIVGKLITPYSSQTTAHILDAIKEGAIYNENDYTFGTFKTLIDVGMDYRTAIAFLMQPGVTKIVDAYYETKSIYVNSNSNAINTAIKRIASDLGITISGKAVTDYTPINSVIYALSTNNKLREAFWELFSVNIGNENLLNVQKFRLNGKQLQSRLKQVEISNNPELLPEDKVYRDAAFDLAMIITFNNIRNTTRSIEALARCSNPDRFGAKQTIRATRKTLDNIRAFAKGTIEVNGQILDNATANTIKVGDKTLIDALYPDINSATGIDINKGAYPYLAAFLKYATIPSVEANSQLFRTESPLFNAIVDKVQTKLGVDFTDEQYSEYKQYMVSNMYSAVQFLTTPLTLNDYGLVTFDNETIKKQTENNTFYWNQERARIFGYDTTQSSSIVVADINNPTKEEINDFNALTPAQKVIWIQRNFTDNRGIFDFLDVNMFNQYEFKQKGFSNQTIRYSDQVDDIEELYIAFRDSFFNKNPLVRLASVDLIKYAFVVEGFRFKKGGISKIITNDALYSNLEDKGMNIIEAVQQQFNIYSNPLEGATDKFIEKYIRSHSEIVKEVNIPKPKKDKQGNENISYKLNRYTQSENIIYIPFNESAKEVLEYISIKEDSPREYIRLNRYVNNNQRRTTLYKITANEKGVYLAPLNLLERNETSDYSANNKNNIYRAYDYYKAIIDATIDNGVSVNELLKDEKAYEEIKILKKQFTITPHKSKHVIETIDNINEIQRILTYGNETERANVGKFVNDINDYINSPVEGTIRYGVVRNDSRYIASIIPGNVSIIQNIPIGDDVNTVKITRYKPSEHFKWVLKGDQRGKMERVYAEEVNALENSINAKSVNPTLYRIELVTEQAQREEYEQLTKEIEDSAAEQMNAVTNMIEDVDVDVAFKFDDTDKVAKDIFNELNRRSVSQEDTAASDFKRFMDINGVDRTSAQYIHNNKKNIYTAAAKYYVRKAHELLSSIDKFSTMNGEVYNISDKALYKHLAEHPEDYPILVKLILDAKTFGDQFNAILNINFDSEDEATAKAINQIKDAINTVKNNKNLKDAVNLLFNDYFANNFSTNPNIRHGLIELKTAFGDTNWIDLNFSDIGELNHKQVQTVVKHVYSILNEATQIIAPKAVNTFNKQFEDIMNRSDSFNWDNIITKQGKFVPIYTDKFLEDRQRIIDNVKVAKENYGEDSLEYIKAKLERDKWRAKNLHQEVVNTYYNKNNALTENVLKNAPNEYVEYMKLIHELYNDSRTTNLLSKEERERRRQLNQQIKTLTSDIKEDGTLKSDEARYRANRLKEFIEAKRALNKEYFDYNESDGFKETLEYYNKIIAQYEKKHPYDTLDQKLLNEDYKEAYDWVQANTVYTIDTDSQEKINKAFATLKDNDNVGSKKVAKILKEADAYDDYGNIDARKLSDEQIKDIKEATSHKFSWTYDSNAGEAILIKDVPAGLPVLKDSFYRMLRADTENGEGVNKLRLQIIGRINELIAKGIDANTGAISSKALFDNLTQEELNELSSNYKALHMIKGNRNNKELAKKFKKNVKFMTHDEAFNREWAYAQMNLKGSRQFDLWLSIFVQSDKEGNYVTDKKGKFIPNNDIFGYIVPKDNTYIDAEKTEARRIIESNIEFVPNEYYYSAMNEVSRNGTFDNWYEANHIFNPYTHKMEPLKVWTTMQVKPGGEFNGQYSYNPTYENLERTVKDEFKNHNYKEYSTNYNIETGEYNNLTNLTKKEKDMRDLLQSTINAYASTHSMKTFAERGFLPRRAKYEPDARWYAKQVIGSLGLEFRNTGEAKWSDYIDYAHDFDADFDMMSLIKQKGYKEHEPIDSRGTRETEEEYAKRVAKIREINKAIDEENLRLDNELLDRDWKSVFNDFIAKGTEYNARQKVKNTVYLLLEDLKDTPAEKVSRWSGNLKKDSRRSTVETTEYQKINQENTHKIVENWARRILYKQFKKDSKYTKWADLMQNITSAKYMIFNVTGGIANIGTGLTNIFNETFAKDYFDNATFAKAKYRYMNNSLSFLADMYSPTTNNLTVGITKLFDIVDFDAFNERRPNETASEKVRRVRDGLYSMQSGGEHYMQNTVLFAMLKSHRIFTDTDGKLRVGSISDYIWETEISTLMGMLRGREDYLLRYQTFVNEIKKDRNEIKKYDTFSRDFNEEFLRDLGDKALIKEYIAERKKAIDAANKEFIKNPLLEEQFELVDGVATLKDGSPVTGYMLGEFRQKVISVNKKIHGVYDKVGAAKIESEWWGSLVMQYHKHIYPGIMKRYRTKGYYNEIRSSIEKGSYISLGQYLATEFRGLKKRVNNKVEMDNENVALASIKEVAKAAIDTLFNAKLNYQLMPEWERNNMKRVLGDLLGISSAFLVAIGIHLMTDDDEIKESELLSTVLYMADRLNSESAMYTPWGLYGEGKTLWSSPIAAQNGPADILKGLGLGINIMFNDDFNSTYTTGLYKGQNKLAVLIYRNTPIYRVYQRLSTMTKNNKYYRINETALNIKLAKNIADSINPD